MGGTAINLRWDVSGASKILRYRLQPEMSSDYDLQHFFLWEGRNHFLNVKIQEKSVKNMT